MRSTPAPCYIWPAMAQQSAGGRIYAAVTGGYEKVSGSLAAYLNKRFNPRTSVIEVLCCLIIAGGVVWIATQVTAPQGADRFQLMVATPAVGAAVSMAATFAVYLGLLFLVEVPTGARVAGALLSAAVAGAAVQMLLLAKLPGTVAAAGLVIGPALVMAVRCRLGFLESLGISGVAAILLAILREILRG